MALDRFVHWKTDRHPTREDVGKVCEDFMVGVGAVTWNEKIGRWIITLPGKCSHPLRRMTDYCGVRIFEGEKHLRWIEVFLHDANCDHALDVITRQHDDFTNGLAERLADVFARFWEGEVQE